MIPLVSIGLENYVATDKITLIVANVKSAPTRDLIRKKRDEGKCFDMTGGRACLSVIITRDNQIILSAKKAKTIASRINESRMGAERDDNIEMDKMEAALP